MRGADSLVIALALPLTIHGAAPLPARDLIIFVTVGVIFMTLVVQGFSLVPLVRRVRTEYQQRKRSAKRTHVPEGEGAEREGLIRLGEEGTIGGDVMRHLQRQQDLRDMLLS